MFGAESPGSIGCDIGCSGRAGAVTMTRVEHLAIDGSVVSIEADTDVSTEATATGWAVVPSLMRTHPFTISPAGHSGVVEDAMRGGVGDVVIGDAADFSVKGGRLRIVEVTLPTATGGERTLTVGAWEGERGCLTTSLIGSQTERLVEVFDTLAFSERSRGLAIDAPVTARPREPELTTEVPGLGVLGIRPAIASVLEVIPRARGHRTSHGELFRVRATSNALTLVTSSAVTAIQPLNGGSADELVGLAERLQVEWAPVR